MVEAGRLVGKVAAVTGATSGSGRAVAHRFVAEGAHVVLLARGSERLDQEVETLGSRSMGIPIDVGDPDSVRSAFDEIGTRFGKLDVLVNNAAVYRPCAVADLSDFDIERQIATNLLGTIYTCRTAIPLLRAAGGGDIVNTSSESTLDPFPMLSIYVASKAGLEAFTHTLALEMSDEDIRVTLVVQGRAHGGEGSTDWSWEPQHAEKAFAMWTEQGYLARIGGDAPGQTVEDVAEVHVFAVTRPRGQRLDIVHVRSR